MNKSFFFEAFAALMLFALFACVDAYGSEAPRGIEAELVRHVFDIGRHVGSWPHKQDAAVVVARHPGASMSTFQGRSWAKEMELRGVFRHLSRCDKACRRFGAVQGIALGRRQIGIAAFEPQTVRDIYQSMGMNPATKDAWRRSTGRWWSMIIAHESCHLVIHTRRGDEHKNPDFHRCENNWKNAIRENQRARMLENILTAIRFRHFRVRQSIGMP